MTTYKFWVVFVFLSNESECKMKLGVCDVCKKDIIREQYSDYTIEGCSDFCETTSLEEKKALKDLQEGDYGLWPCSECGCAIQDEYVPGGHCSKCVTTVKLKEQEKKIATLQKELGIAKNEAVLWKNEAEKAYEFNRKANEWWKFKFERFKLGEIEKIKFSLPWKKVAKRILARETQWLHEYEKFRTEYSALMTKINGPKSIDFINSTLQEAVYQQTHRYDFDKFKPNVYWPWLIGTSVTKAIVSTNGTSKHNIIAIAAAACNWWNSKNQENSNE